MRFICWILLPGVGDEKKEHSASHPNGLPTSFTGFDALNTADVQRIVEHERRGFKADAVLLTVKLIFAFIPGEQM